MELPSSAVRRTLPATCHPIIDAGGSLHHHFPMCCQSASAKLADLSPRHNSQQVCLRKRNEIEKFRTKSQQIITKLNKLETDYKSCRQAVGANWGTGGHNAAKLSCGYREVRSTSPHSLRASFLFCWKKFFLAKCVVAINVDPQT